ncbi:sialate O-acetylesterase [Halorhabdus sp. BNX81]|uniref:sialate O-acetylesterase n=1 Tax=Halorhabdus sp. BNX81 TaxID=2980181 RepID=UPI0023DD0C22|nr:sialate O-acetylesterase [Halorhabdus sp. BNX81]WEL22212.1 Carbohydrate-binding family V [Halorhabdus sp. BNX81]
MTRRAHDTDDVDEASGSGGEQHRSNEAAGSQGDTSRRAFLKSGVAVGAGTVALGLGQQASAATATDPSNLDLYLLFGQSNMEGQGPIEEQDRGTNPRIHVLADKTCPNLDREYGEWYLAEPPLNRCYGQLGPGDYFAKTLIEELPDDRSIGLVPAAVSGADIALFEKGAPIGRNDRDIPPQFDGGYEWMVDLAETAQQVGTFKGILFHQGETNTNDQQWTAQVEGIVKDLRADLGIGNVPFLAGEMLYDSAGGCCGSHNTEVNELPDVIENAHVVSAEGLAGQDYAHFTSDAYRELGRRYAAEMLEHVDVSGGTDDGSGGNSGDDSGGNDGDGSGSDSDDDSDSDTGDSGDDSGDDAGSDSGGSSEYPTWDSTAVYRTGDRVVHDGRVWEAQWYTLDQEPREEDYYVWQPVDGSSTGGSAGSDVGAGSGDTTDDTAGGDIGGSDDSGSGGDAGDTDGSDAVLAEVEPSTTSASVGERVTFRVTDTSGEGHWIASLSFDFGDGSTATGWWAAHTYDSAGTYTVALTATSDGGDSSTHEVTITVS